MDFRPGLFQQKYTFFIYNSRSVWTRIHFNRLISCSTKEPGLTDIFINFYMTGSIHWLEFDHLSLFHIQKFYKRMKIKKSIYSQCWSNQSCKKSSLFLSSQAYNTWCFKMFLYPFCCKINENVIKRFLIYLKKIMLRLSQGSKHYQICLFWIWSDQRRCTLDLWWENIIRELQVVRFLKAKGKKVISTYWNMKKTYNVKKAKIVFKMANDSNKTKRPKYRLSRKCSFYIHDKHICEVKSFFNQHEWLP